MSQISLHEAMAASNRNKTLVQHWAPYINAAVKAGAPMDDVRAANLARVLENTQRAFEKADRGSFNEATHASSVGPFRLHAFEIITAMAANSIASEICSEQALPQKQGQIFYLDYLYGSNKGPIKAGEAMWTRGQDMTTAEAQALGVHPKNVKTYQKGRYYASEIINDEIIAESGDTKIEGNLPYYPVIPNSVVIQAGSVTLKDNGTGDITGTGLKDGADAEIDYATGAYEFTLSSAATDDVLVSYEYDQGHAPAQVPQVDVQVRQGLITARSHKLRALWAFDAAYDLQTAHGLDLEAAMLETLTAELRHEADAQIITDMYNQAGLTSTYNDYYDASTMHFTRGEHCVNFISELVNASNQIFMATRRNSANFLVVGKKAADILETIGAPRYVGSGSGLVNGPHFAGTLDNRWKVYKDPFLPENAYLLGYKGDMFLDAGYIYAPYLPVYATQTVMLDDFVGRKGFATSFGKRMVNRNLYVKGTITNEAPTP